MFVSPAFAQATGTSPGFGDFAGMILPLALIMVVFYFLLIRPQQKRMKEHQEMLGKVTRGDTVVVNGLIGKVNKVIDEREVLVEFADNVKIRVARSGITDVRSKGEPVKDEAK